MAPGCIFRFDIVVVCISISSTMNVVPARLVLPRHAALPPRWTANTLLAGRSHPLLPPSSLAAATAEAEVFLPTLHAIQCWGRHESSCLPVVKPRTLLACCCYCQLLAYFPLDPGRWALMGHTRIQRRHAVRVFCIITSTKVLSFLLQYPHYSLCVRLTAPPFFFRVLNSNLMCLVPAVNKISLKRAGCYYLPCYHLRFSKGQRSLACLVSVLIVCFFLTDVWTRLLVMDLTECYHRRHLMMFDCNEFTSFSQFDVNLQWIFGSSE
jgi:hypothetical protein